MKKNIAGASSSENEAKDFCQVLEHEIVDIIQVFSKERKHRTKQVSQF